MKPAFARRFGRNRSGGIAVSFALATPVLALLACGAVDLAAVVSSRTDMQAAADAAALNAAHQLEVSDEAGIKARAEQLVRGQLTGLAGVTYVVRTTVGKDASDVTVAIDGNRPSFFANLLPPGGWNFSVTATAKPMARQPLCVLTTSTATGQDITLRQQAKISAPECMVSSNAGITVDSTAAMSAAAVQSSGPASGPITPSAMTGAPTIADPFAKMAIKPDNMPCQLGDLLSILGILQGTFHIPPGVHCGNIIIGRNQKVVLQKGEHYFLNSKLILQNNAELEGEDVVIVFDSKSDFKFADQSAIRLKGRKSGVFSGFVIATTRENTRTFEISSDNARELLGTIYVPSAKLLVTGQKNEVADQSAWTVILAQQLELTGSASLVVNAAYAGSGVPVPKGVGPLSGVAMTR
jgi:Flp pilus assembly protein TadG